MIKIEPKHKRRRLLVTTGWACGKPVTLVGFAEGEGGLSVTHVGTGTSIISAVPGSGDALVKLGTEVLGCYYRNLDPIPCQVLVVQGEEFVSDTVERIAELDDPRTITALADLGLQFLPRDYYKQKHATARLCKSHGAFQWTHFCQKAPIVIVGVD